MAPAFREEIVVPFRLPEATLGHAIRIRTTLIVSSLQSLRRRGLIDPYLAHLPAEHHAAVQSMIAGQWTPMSLGMAHYTACEALRLPPEEVNLIGREVGSRIEGTFLATMVSMAGKVGATPWTALAQTGHLYARLFAGGGGIRVSRVGPKDARATMAGVEVAQVPYFRGAMAGVFENRGRALPQQGVRAHRRRALSFPGGAAHRVGVTGWIEGASAPPHGDPSFHGSRTLRLELTFTSSGFARAPLAFRRWRTGC